MRYNLKILLVTVALFAPNMAYTAPKKSSAFGDSDGKDKDRTFYFSMPVVAERPQLRPHLELNLGDEAGLALEGAIIGETEELTQQEINQTGNSMKVKGLQGSPDFKI